MKEVFVIAGACLILGLALLYRDAEADKIELLTKIQSLTTENQLLTKENQNLETTIKGMLMNK